MIQAVVFDLDGVLVESERLWDDARREVAARYGGRWREGATAAMQGMSAPEWTAYMRAELGVDLDVERINDVVVEALLERYRQRLPLLPGSVESVERIGSRWPLALASSSNRVVIEAVLALTGLHDRFGVTVSSEEVPGGKPAPDVYLEAARRLERPPQVCAAVEDSANGIRSALAARMRVVAVPNREYPPPPSVLAGVDAVVTSLEDLRVEMVERLAIQRSSSTTRQPIEERIDEAEVESFPASDSHIDWAGPPG